MPCGICSAGDLRDEDRVIVGRQKPGFSEKPGFFTAQCCSQNNGAAKPQQVWHDVPLRKLSHEASHRNVP
jgi:hypothetical protein